MEALTSWAYTRPPKAARSVRSDRVQRHIERTWSNLMVALLRRGTVLSHANLVLLGGYSDAFRRFKRLVEVFLRALVGENQKPPPGLKDARDDRAYPSQRSAAAGSKPGTRNAGTIAAAPAVKHCGSSSTGAAWPGTAKDTEKL